MDWRTGKKVGMGEAPKGRLKGKVNLREGLAANMDTQGRSYGQLAGK